MFIQESLFEPATGLTAFPASHSKLDLSPVFEINQQALSLLRDLALGGATVALPLIVSEPLRAWRDLSDAGLQQLAASPVLLLDAGFGLNARWSGWGERAVQDAAAGAATPEFFAPIHWSANARDLLRRVLNFAWHLARSEPPTARFVLGMNEATARHFGQLSLADLDWITEYRPGWIRPRWDTQPETWASLLNSAESSEADALVGARLRSIQMRAMEYLAT